MKMYIFFILLPAFLQVTAQDENLMHSIGKKPFERPSAATMFLAGFELSTVPSINTSTKDSNNTSVYTGFYINYQHKSNLGLEVKSSVLPGGSDPGFYLTSVSPYYANYNGTVIPYISYTRYISHHNPSVPYSPIQNNIYAHVRVNTNIVDPIVGVDAGFGNDEQNDNESVTDFNAFAAISHVFISGSVAHKKAVFAFFPTLQVNAGTDRYFKFLRTTKYISQNRSPKQMGIGTGRSRNSRPGRMPESRYVINEENSFRISNAEVNLYLMYFIGNFFIEPSGSLFFPLREYDKNPYGYWQLNLNYWFR